MRHTWYVLDDGSVVDPNEVAPDETGLLRHKSGVAVAMRGGVPHSRGVDVAESRQVVAEPPKTSADREMTPGAKKYKTR